MTRLEPTRWKEDSATAPDGVGEALRVYGARRADAHERQLLSERLAALLAKPEPSELGARRAGRALSRKARALGLLVIVGLAALVATQQQRAVPMPAATQPPARLRALPSAVPIQSQPMAAPESTAVAETAVVPASGAPAHRSRTRSPRQVQPAVRALSTAGTATPERELALLRKAQEALNRTPSEARVYLEEHARDYPSGTFEQEREMLFIELAVTQGERNHARWLARRFLTRFPGTTYQRHLETLLADDPTQLEQETKPATHTQSMDPNGGDQHATGSSH